MTYEYRLRVYLLLYPTGATWIFRDPSESIPDLCSKAFTGTGWTLVAHMRNSGGMFAGNSNLSPTYSFGTFIEGPFSSTSDFYRPFTVLSPTEILFVTGNCQFFARGDYYNVLQVVKALAGDAGPNIDFTIGLNGAVSATRCNILSRGSNPEDPWITLGASHDPSRIIWGENGYIGSHSSLKNTNGGVNVYTRSIAVSSFDACFSKSSF